MHPRGCILRLRVTLPGLQVNPAGQQAVAFIQLFRKEKVCLRIALQRLPAQPLKGIGIALQGSFPAPVQALPGIFCCAFALLIVLPQLRLRRGEQRLDAIWFNFSAAPSGNTVRAAYRLAINDYNGVQTPQLMIEHLA